MELLCSGEGEGVVELLCSWAREVFWSCCEVGEGSVVELLYSGAREVLWSCCIVG